MAIGSYQNATKKCIATSIFPINHNRELRGCQAFLNKTSHLPQGFHAHQTGRQQIDRGPGKRYNSEHAPGSFNGRTSDFGSDYRGSSPCPGASFAKPTLKVSEAADYQDRLHRSP